MQVPESIRKFFDGAGGINVMASPCFLRQHTGLPRIYLPDYDIYHGGKDDKGTTVYTRYRILGKESIHNTIQGIIEMHIIEGYGLKDRDNKEFIGFLRPNDAKKMMTTGSTSIKRNSVITLKSGLLLRLEDVENFCDLPIINKARLSGTQTHVAISKRETYKSERGLDNWAHVKRGALARDMERSVHKLLLPYYRKYRSEEDKDRFFRTFMEDLMVVCNAHHSNFIEDGRFMDVMEDILSSSKEKKRSLPCLINETRPRKKWRKTSCSDVLEEVGLSDASVVDPETSSISQVEVSVEVQVKQALKNVSKTKLSSIIF